MIRILPTNPRIVKRLDKFSLKKKYEKQLKLLSQNPKHPGLRLELLEPKQHGIYSFRIDRKFRALFIYRSDKQAVEILTVTIHYQ